MFCIKALNKPAGSRICWRETTVSKGCTYHWTRHEWHWVWMLVQQQKLPWPFRCWVCRWNPFSDFCVAQRPRWLLSHA